MKTCLNCKKDYDTATDLCLDCLDIVCLYQSDDMETPCFKTKGSNQEVCINCSEKIRAIQDSQAVIFRQDNLPKTHHLTGIEMVGIRTEHYNWCASTFIDGPDAIERISRHINDIQRKIEILRTEESGARQKKSELEFKETENLTAEERIRWEKDAVRMKTRTETRAKLNGEKKAETKAEDKELKKLMKTVDETTAKWILEVRSGSDSRLKMVANMVALGVPKNLAEGMVPK